jgi:hypothetical protein
MKAGLLVLFLLCVGGIAQEQGSGDVVTTPEYEEDITEDIVTTTTAISDIIADIIEASGEEGSGDLDEPLVVTNSASYSMVSQDGKSSATIIIQAISGNDKLNLVCDFSSTDGSMFSDQGCVPAIYIVSGHSSCASLPTEVIAKKLADIHEAGEGEVLVDATWAELPGKCIIILREAACSEADGSGDDSVIVNTTEIPVEESDEITGSGDIDNSLEAGNEVHGDDSEESSDLIETMDLERSLVQRRARRYRTLRSTGLGRSYGTISLAGFSFLSSGSTNAFTVSIPSIVSVPIYTGITHTNYNKYATLPLLQLTGWTYDDAVSAGIATILLYLAVFHLPNLVSSFQPIKRRILNFSESDDFSSRMDALQDGVIDILGNTVSDFAGPWVGIVKQFGRNLLNRRYGEYYPTAQQSPYSTYLDQRTAWHEENRVGY